MKKYKLTNETKEWCGTTLHRIEYLKDFSNVKKGEKGGWIEKEENLSQDGNARVSGDAQVYGNAQVFGNARVYGDARVYGELKLIGGYFYHTKSKTEVIEKVELENDYELLCREPKLDKEEEDNLVGKEVEVTVGGKKYKAVIQEA